MSLFHKKQENYDNIIGSIPIVEVVGGIPVIGSVSGYFSLGMSILGNDEATIVEQETDSTKVHIDAKGKEPIFGNLEGRFILPGKNYTEAKIAEPETSVIKCTMGPEIKDIYNSRNKIYKL
jgi:hypothetical protein